MEHHCPYCGAPMRVIRKDGNAKDRLFISVCQCPGEDCGATWKITDNQPAGSLTIEFAWFVCPECHSTDVVKDGDALHCNTCDHWYRDAEQLEYANAVEK